MTPERKALLGELISEAVAIFIVISFGCSVAGMYILYDPSPYKTAYWGVCITWGMAVSISIYVTGAVSGTHANPAVTLSLAVYRGFPWKKVPLYWAAQVVGAFLGAALVYALYYTVIDHFNATEHLTRAAGGAAGVFFTSPGTAITPMKGFFDEIILTGLLMFGIFAVTDEFNTMAPQANYGANRDRSAGRDHRCVGGLSRGVGAQPGARLRAQDLRLADGLGRIRLPRRRQLLVGADRRPSDWRADRRRRAASADPPLPAARQAGRRTAMIQESKS